MRKTLFAAASAAALMALAAPALAQNISVQNNQFNAGAVGSRLNVSGATVGSVLDGRSTAIGNLYQLSAPTGQGIAEVASNNGGTNSPQANAGAITANANVSGVAGGALIAVQSTAAGNAINSEGVIVSNSGNRVLGQNNSGAVAANLTAYSVSAGNLTLGSTAIGNSFSADASSAVSLGLGQSNGGAFTQTNSGAVSADVAISYNVGATSTERVNGTAVGNAASFDAPSVGVAMTQGNSGAQTATVNFNDGGVSRGSLAVGATAIGNTIQPTGGTFSTFGAGLVQSNTAGQASLLNVNGGAAFNGSTADFASTAVGNAISVNQTGAVNLNGSQTNSGVGQSAVLNINAFQGGGVGSSGALSGSATAVGNLVSIDTNGSFGSGLSQSNNAPVYANLNGGSIIAGTSANLSSLAAGNILQVTGLQSIEGINGAANQSNFGSISSLTNITSGSFANLTAGATSVGNMTSVSIR